MSYEPRLSDEECAVLLNGWRAGLIAPREWRRHLHDNPELAAFVRDVERRERHDHDAVSAVLKRCGYRVH